MAALPQHCGDERLRALMIAYQDGNLDAFDGLYELLDDELRRFFGARCRDAARIDDLTQETFLQIHRSRRSYLRDRPVRPWVYAIAKRAFLMHVRQVHRRESPESTGLIAVPEPHASTSEHMRLELADALTRLSGDSRRAFLLHHWIGLSFREIGAVLGIQPGAAKLRSSRAARRLRALLVRPAGRVDE
jgi:RNA polymerase sigma-70 factor (ECF subfamily)